MCVFLYNRFICEKRHSRVVADAYRRYAYGGYVMQGETINHEKLLRGTKCYRNVQVLPIVIRKCEKFNKQ